MASLDLAEEEHFPVERELPGDNEEDVGSVFGEGSLGYHNQVMPPQRLLQTWRKGHDGEIERGEEEGRQKREKRRGVAVEMTIDMVSELPIFKSILITAKVILACSEEQVYNGKIKQDVQLTDITGSISLVLWEDDVGKLVGGVWY